MAASEEATARLLVRQNVPDAARKATFHHCGTGIEYALKALIMRREGLNQWPGRTDPGGYWTHDLKKLKARALLKLTPTHPVAPAWSIMVRWDRGQDYLYDPKPLPRKVALAYVEATFGPNGVVQWIKSELT